MYFSAFLYNLKKYLLSPCSFPLPKQIILIAFYVVLFMPEHFTSLLQETTKVHGHSTGSKMKSS